MMDNDLLQPYFDDGHLLTFVSDQSPSLIVIPQPKFALLVAVLLFFLASNPPPLLHPKTTARLVLVHISCVTCPLAFHAHAGDYGCILRLAVFNLYFLVEQVLMPKMA